MAKQYVRVTFKRDGGRCTVRLVVSTDNGKLLTGFEVNKEGDEVIARVDGKPCEKFYVIAAADIIKRVPLRMNNHYAELEPSDE